jgi:hypothetical protein
VLLVRGVVKTLFFVLVFFSPTNKTKKSRRRRRRRRRRGRGYS